MVVAPIWFWKGMSAPEVGCNGFGTCSDAGLETPFDWMYACLPGVLDAGGHILVILQREARLEQVVPVRTVVSYRKQPVVRKPVLHTDVPLL